MENKTSTGLTSYQVHGINSGRGFVRGHGNAYGRGLYHGFNPTKPKVREKFEALGNDAYSTGDARQAYNYTKTMEVLINCIQINFNGGKYAKSSLKELNHFEFNITRPKTPDSIPSKGLIEKLFLERKLRIDSYKKLSMKTICIRQMHLFKENSPKY